MISIANIKTSLFKKSRSKDTEYLYATAYIRSVEEKGLCRDLLARMLDAPSADDALTLLKEAYHGVADEIICDEIVNEAYRTVDDIVSVPDMFAFMRYPYDANNIKTAIKCGVKGTPVEGLMFGCGTLSESAYGMMAETGNFSELPSAIADAAKNAADAFVKTGDPQSIDLPIDRACLEAMMDEADRTGSAFIKATIRIRIDIANVMTALRVARMGSKTADGILATARAEGGSIPKAKLISAATEDAPVEAIGAVTSVFSAELADVISPDKKLGDLERELENRYLAAVYAAKSVSFGCEVPYAYLVAAEYNSKNARIILAGKRAGLPPDSIRERMRLYYV